MTPRVSARHYAQHRGAVSDSFRELGASLGCCVYEPIATCFKNSTLSTLWVPRGVYSFSKLAVATTATWPRFQRQ